MRFGAFLAPSHPAGQNPTYALERDLNLIVRLDRFRELERFAQHVMARVDGRADAPARSWAWVDGQAEPFAGENLAAIVKASAG